MNEDIEYNTNFKRIFKLILNHIIDINIPIIIGCMGICNIYIDMTQDIPSVDGYVGVLGAIMLVASLIIIGIIKLLKFILRKIFNKKREDFINLVIIIFNLFIALFPLFRLLGTLIGWDMALAVYIFNTLIISILFLMNIYSFINEKENKVKDYPM